MSEYEDGYNRALKDLQTEQRITALEQAVQLLLEERAKKKPQVEETSNGRN